MSYPPEESITFTKEAVLAQYKGKLVEVELLIDSIYKDPRMILKTNWNEGMRGLFKRKNKLCDIIRQMEVKLEELNGRDSNT